MLVRKGIIYCHIMEVWLHKSLVKAFNHCEVETRVHETSAQVSFDHIGQALDCPRQAGRNNSGFQKSYLWGVFGDNPEIYCPVAFVLRRLDLLNVVGYLRLQCVAEVSKMSVHT